MVRPSRWLRALVQPAIGLGIVLPPLIASRLYTDQGTDWVAAGYYVDLLAPWAPAVGWLCGLLFVAGVDRRRAYLLSFAALLAPAVGMAALAPFELRLDSPWRSLLSWVAAGFLPCWAAMRAAAAQGGTALIAGPAAAAASTLIGLGAVLWQGLGASARAVPIAAAGLVCTLTLIIAAEERVTASLRSLSAVAVLASAAAAGGAAAWIGSPPIASWSVQDVVDSRPWTGRLLLWVTQPNRDRPVIVRFDQVSGRFDPLPPSVIRAALLGDGADDIRIVLPPALEAVGIASPRLRTGSGRSGPRLGPGRILLLGTDRRSDWVYAAREQEIVAWNVASGRRLRHREEQGEIRWPCFDEQGHLLWRVTRPEGPFDLHLLALDSGAVESRPGGSPVYCADGEGGPGRLERGDPRVGRPSRLVGPGAGAEGTVIPDPVGSWTWSQGGAVGAFISGAEEPFAMTLWRVGDPPDPPRTVVGGPLGGLDAAGRRLAYIQPDGGSAAVRVLELDGGADRIAPVPVQLPAQLAWGRDGSLLVVQDGGLYRLDTGSGRVVRLGPG